MRLCPGAPADAPRTLSATAPATGQTRLLAVLTLRTRIRPISLPTRQQKRPFSRKTLPCRHPKRQYSQSECQHGKAPNRMPLSVDLVQPVFGRGPGPFRNLNRTLGPTRPILSFTPCSSHGVNRTLPFQTPFCRGMTSFNFRACGRGSV